MENVRNFVDLVALGDNIAAREELDKILSQKSFEALDSRKQQIAGAIFGTTEEPELDLDNAVAELEDEEAYAEDVEHDGEQLDEVSMKLATKVNRMRRGESMDNTVRGMVDRSFDSSKPHTNTDGKYRSGDSHGSGYSKSIVSARHIAKKSGGQTRLDRIEKTSD